jgi:hypothetical protein
VSGPAGYAGTSVNIDQVVFLASVTGISAPALPGSPVSVIYVGREAMGVFTVNTSLKSAGVFRGYMGTQAAPHPSGDMVLISNVYATNQAFGANPVPSGFYNTDPPAGGTCVPSGVPTTPWVNVTTGMQWLCSSDTLTWVPGFNYGIGAGGLANVPTAGTEASAAGTNAVLGPVFSISGTNAIVTFTPPVGFNATAVGGGCFTVIPKGIFTWTAAGNISVAGTTTAITQNVSFCWNPYTSKWVPSRVA